MLISFDGSTYCNLCSANPVIKAGTIEIVRRSLLESSVFVDYHFFCDADQTCFGILLFCYSVIQKRLFLLLHE